MVSKIIPKKDIEQAMDILIPISKPMEEAINLWNSMYEGKAPWLDKKNPESLNLPTGIASELARLVVLELKSEITGNVSEAGEEDERAKYLNMQYKSVMKVIRQQVEYACASGGIMMKPYIDGDKVVVDYVQAGEFYPVKYDANGNITACIFPERKYKKDKVYTRLEYHDFLKEGQYLVRNTAYMVRGDSNTLGKQIKLSEVEEWKGLAEEVIIKIAEKPLFSYFKMPMANHIDKSSPLGISVYSRAVEQIKDTDKHYGRINWEYEASEMAINASRDLFRQDGTVASGKDRLYKKLDTDQADFFEEWTPDIRDKSLYNGLNKYKRHVEFLCGLAYGTLSDVNEQDKTAEEIKSSKQRSYSTVSDIQGSLEEALIDLVYAMDIWTTVYSLAPGGKYDISFEWDDSLIVDSKTEQSIMLQEVASGLIKPEEYLMRRYGVTKKVAKEMLPNMNDQNLEDDGIE